jgi:polysaccharide biosynthesis protein PslH
MRILFLTPRLPYPPIQGDRVKAYRLLKYLSKNHHVTIVTFLERKEEHRNIERVREICAELYTVPLPTWRSIVNCGFNIIGSKPFQLAYYYSKHYQVLVGKLIQNESFDIIHTHLLRLLPYTIDIRGLPKVIDLTDAISLYLSRYADAETNIIKKTAIKTERNRIVEFERLVENYNRVFVCSEKDKDYLQEKYGISNVEVTYNCVDLRNTILPRNEGEIPQSVIFSGNFSYPPNADAARYLIRRLFPEIRKRVHGATLLLVGRNPTKEMKHIQDKSIIVTGYVENMNEWYQKASVAVSPVRFGAGTLNKVLEPMALGKMVVATTVGVEGLGLRDGIDLQFAHTENEFVTKTVEALTNHSLRNTIGHNAKETIINRFSCSAVGKKVSDIYQTVIKNFQAGVI